MNLSEKKAFIIEQLDNIKDELMMDGIIEYITKSSQEEILEKTDAFFQNFSARYSNVLQKLAE
jgi:hypothetical protein